MPPIDGTPAAILARLRDRPRQAQDLAAHLGIDTSAVRRHLENLRGEGLVETEDVIDGPGRPKKMYALTWAGRETFPRDYALLLDLVLGKLEEARGRNELERVAKLIAKDIASQVDGRTRERRIAALVELYNRLGFEASIEPQGDGYVLCQRNCIFLKTARSDPPLMCQCFDEGIIGEALPDAGVELESSLAHGDAHCRHRIRFAKAA